MTPGSGPAPEARSSAGTVLTSQRGARPVDEAVAAARRVIAALVHAGGGTADLSRVAGELDAVADHLERHSSPPAVRLSQPGRGATYGRHDPATGVENALAPPMVVRGLENGSVRAVVTLGLPYQGPPGHVHGGISALVLDHVLGLSTVWRGRPGVTARLDVRYHRRTPLFEELTVTARQESVDGRRMRVVGEIRTADGEVCVSAQGMFVSRSDGPDGPQS